MTDWADRAKVVEEQVLAAQIAEFRGRRRQVESAARCRVCGDEIAEARRRAVATDHCAFCADEIERRASWLFRIGRAGSA